MSLPTKNIIKHNDYSIEYFINDCLAKNSIAKGIIWEPHILEFAKFYNEKYNLQNIIDVGANLGYHTLFFSSLVKNKGLVFSFEPQNQNYELLINNIYNNNIDNVVVYNQACSNNFKIIQIPIMDTTRENNMGDFTPNIINNYNILGTHKSSSVTLDSINFPKIDMIKIDVQGYEKFVLEGSQNLITKNRPIIIIEFEYHQLVKTNITVLELISYIRNLDYYIFYLDYEYPSDHVCVPNEKLEEFKIIFTDYIREHSTDNMVNHNILFGINMKISMNY